MSDLKIRLRVAHNLVDEEDLKILPTRILYSCDQYIGWYSDSSDYVLSLPAENFDNALGDVIEIIQNFEYFWKVRVDILIPHNFILGEVPKYVCRGVEQK